MHQRVRYKTSRAAARFGNQRSGSQDSCPKHSGKHGFGYACFDGVGEHV